MSESNSPRVYSAICNVIYDLSREGLAKNNRNQAQGYNFRGIDDVYNVLSPLLARHELCVLPRVISREVTEKTNAKGTTLFYTVVHVEFDFVSAVDGSKHTVATVGEAMDSGDKSSNKAMSAAYKYAAFQAFAIPTEGDNDADATTHEVAQRSAPPAISESELADCLIAMNDADSLEALKGLFGGAWKRATLEQRNRLQTRYDERKTALSEPAHA
ncbi:ERF family protein [Caballeronia sp. NCTM1]|uniref:ERF family protein n=1 Tax=Caballeronia sp. NCTM1 TaxID=2921753 RepID=UPI0020291106|nr:ERF family protein [Caballeronia sp. NCTM1]